MLRPGFRINDPSVIFQLFDDEVVAIHLASGTYHSLQGIAGEAFQILGINGATCSDVAAELEQNYDAPAARIEQDLQGFFRKLEGEELIAATQVSGRPAPEPKADRVRSTYYPPDFQTHRDLQQLFLIDPVHDVDTTGWPNLPASQTGEAAANLEFRLAGPHVIFEKMPDETVVMHLGTGAYHSLRGAAEDAFSLFPSQPSIEEIVTALAGKYDAPRTSIEAAVREYVAELTAAGLISSSPAGPGRETRILELSRPGSRLPFAPLHVESFQDSTPAHSISAAETAGRGRFRLRPEGLVFGTAGGQCVVADRQFGDYYQLNAPAADVFELLRNHALDSQEIASALLRKYDASERNLLSGVMILLRNLVHVNLAVFDPAETSVPADLPAMEIAGEKQPFHGFECTIHKDLRSSLSPVNAGQPQRVRAPRSGTESWFLEGLRDYFAEAADRAQSAPARSFSIGGSTVRVASAGGYFLDDLTRAFSHLELRPEAEADLTIHVWDTSVAFSDPLVATAIDRLFLDWPAQCGAHGQITGLHGKRISAVYQPGPDLIMAVDRESGEAFCLKRDRTPLPNRVIESPFRPILHAFFSQRDGQFVRGTAVGTDRGGVLLAGKHGSGKSTAAMVCAGNGMGIAGDDYCLVHPDSRHLCSAYNTVRLPKAGDRTALPNLQAAPLAASTFEKADEAKDTYFLSEALPSAASKGFLLRAIVIPVAKDLEETRVEECSPAEALLALLPGTVAYLAGSDEQDGERLSRLARNVPAFRLYLGRDRAGIAAAVRGLLI